MYFGRVGLERLCVARALTCLILLSDYLWLRDRLPLRLISFDSSFSALLSDITFVVAGPCGGKITLFLHFFALLPGSFVKTSLWTLFHPPTCASADLKFITFWVFDLWRRSRRRVSVSVVWRSVFPGSIPLACVFFCSGDIHLIFIFDFCNFHHVRQIYSKCSSCFKKEFKKQLILLRSLWYRKAHRREWGENN